MTVLALLQEVQVELDRSRDRLRSTESALHKVSALLAEASHCAVT